jgi:iron(III) transport system substrate-binding protein
MLHASLRRQRRSAIGLVPLLAVIVFFGIAGIRPISAQSSDDWNDVIAAAKKEGNVVVYSSYLSPTTNNPIATAFEKKYGIHVDYLTARGTEIRERIRAEQASGRFLADVQHQALTLTIASENDDHTLQPLGLLPNAANMKEDVRELGDDYQLPIFILNFSMLINTNLVKAADEPKSWADLLDPKWKDKILSDDPRAAGGGRGMFQMTYNRFGRSFHEKLAAQNLVFARDYEESERRLARGEFAIYIPFILSDFHNLSGLPVKYILPEEGVYYGDYSVSILKKPPHPNAARLFADFYLSNEVQTIYANASHGIVVKTLNQKLPPDVEALANAKLLGPQDNDPKHIDEMYALAKEIYK